ncbi:MAG: hypothetical protein GY810_25220 [Aureispira sp.]|nr:hypothetical protein [Aureispira sp.]
MEYINPFKLFHLSPDCTNEDVERVVQETTQTFQTYPDDKKIYVYGSKYLRTQVERALTDIQVAEKRAFHAKLLIHKDLLNFLEYGHLGYFKSARKGLKNESEAFYSFLAPYFGYQYSESMLQAIKTNDEETLELLASESLPIGTEQEQDYYGAANNYVQDTIAELRKLQERQELVSMSEREMTSHLSDKTIKLYNILPDYFYATRNLIANEVYNLAMVMSTNYGRSDGAQTMLRQGLKLKLDETVKKNLEDLLDKHSFKVGRPPNWLILGVGVIILLFLMKYIETTFFAG